MFLFPSFRFTKTPSLQRQSGRDEYNFLDKNGDWFVGDFHPPIFIYF